MKNEDKRLNRVLNLFSGKCKDNKAKEYRSFSAMRRADKKYTIMLMFGYDKSKNPIYSKPIEIESIDVYLQIQKLLDKGLSVDVVGNDIFDGIEDEEETKNDWSK